MPDQVPEKIKHVRAAELEAVGREIKTELLSDYVLSHSSETGSPVYVLAEKSRAGMVSGHSEHFIEVKIRDCSAKIGEVIPVYLDSSDGEYCYGRKA